MTVLLDRVSEALDDRARLRAFEKSQERLRRFIIGGALQQDRVLIDRRVEIFRDEPLCPPGDAMQLRQGDKAKFGVPGVDELERLRDVVALDELGFAARRRRRAPSWSRPPLFRKEPSGDWRSRALRTFRPKGPPPVGDVDDPAPEHELADRISEAAVRRRRNPARSRAADAPGRPTGRLRMARHG